MMKISGIYSITHTASGRVYIGSSANAPKRVRFHMRNLFAGTHWNAHLQRAWDLYGEEAFLFTVEEIVKDPSKLLEREQAWIDAMKSSDPEHGFNLCPVAGTRAGSKQPASWVRMIKKLHTGKPKSIQQRARMSASAKGR